MATGESNRSLGFQYRVSASYIGVIIKKVCSAIIKHKLQEEMPQPTEEDFLKTAAEFKKRWNFPNCVGAIDGRHTRIMCPSKSGSLYYNYKHFFSIVLFALVDAQYRFVAVDVGAYGSDGDANIFARSVFGEQIRTNAFHIPPPTALPGSETICPHVLLGDQAFKLAQNIMTPYRHKAALEEDGLTKFEFNRRHSRARRVVENAFGILVNVWRIFLTPINMLPETVDKIIMSTCILHNILRRRNVNIRFDLLDPVPDNDSSCFEPLITNMGRPFDSAKEIRDRFKNYFSSPQGALPWEA